MISIKQCGGCFEIKPENNFELVKTGEEFVFDMGRNEQGQLLGWRLQSFHDLLCKECISRIELNY